ncbi:MAG: DUF5057 domain-containing protein [Lachnospiraceae bacterium]
MKKRRIMRTVVFLCVLLAAGILTAHAIGNSTTGKNRIEIKKDSGETFGTTKNPFLIVEVVPNPSMAEIGYQIQGCEPIDMERLSVDSQSADYKEVYGNDGTATVEKREYECFTHELSSGSVINAYQGQNPFPLREGVKISQEAMELNYWTLLEKETTLTGYYEKTKAGTGGIFIKKGRDYVVSTDAEGTYIGDYNWITVNEPDLFDWTGREKRTRTEPCAYSCKKMKITHRNRFLQEAFQTRDEDGAFHTTVVTLTPEDFAKAENLALLEQAELISIHGSGGNPKLEELWTRLNKEGRVLTEEEQKNTSFQNHDLSKSVVDTIVKRMHSAHPAALVMDGYSLFTSAPNSQAQNLVKRLTNLEVLTEKDVLFENIYLYNGTNGGSHSMNSEFHTVTNKTYVDFKGTQVESYATVREAVAKLLIDAMNVRPDKTSLRILEVQACNEFIYGSPSWKEYYKNLIPWFQGDYEKDITVTTMPTWELNGSRLDLNASFDLILVGINQDATNGGMGYNDPQMGSLIYTSIGDMVVKSGTKKEWAKILSDDSVRYSGTDISRKKLKELEAYLQAGYPIALEPGFFKEENKKWKVDTDKIDSSSNMYQLAASYISQRYKTLVTTKETDTTALRKAMGEVCKLHFKKDKNGREMFPTKYTYHEKKDGTIERGTVTYQNQREFKYQFTIEGLETKNYTAALYIDGNVDGIYEGSLENPFSSGSGEESEQMQQIKITDQEGNPIPEDQLKVNTVYTLTRIMGEDFKGIIPWKLQISDSKNPQIRDTKIDYTLFKVNVQDKKKIKVLQMNLRSDMRLNSDVMDEMAYINLETNKQFQRFFDGVDEFNIQIEFLQNKSWYSKFGKLVHKESKEELVTQWKAYLDQYDMLILGFNDCCSYTDDEIFNEGFQYFSDCGKSIILSHDIAKDATMKVTAGHSATVFDPVIRDLLKQRKYQQSTTQFRGKTLNLLPENSLYRSGKKGKQVSEYFDNSIREYIIFGGDQNFSDRDAIRKNYDWGGGDSLTSFVNILNQGVVTNYPYKIPDLIEVGSTHAQNFQLNMESDVIVWAALTDEYSRTYAPQIKSILGKSYRADSKTLGRGVYSSKESDAANGYYLYNIGNITYTGLGHNRKNSQPYNKLTTDEVKLFTNLMISSYRMSADRPEIPILNQEAVSTGEETIISAIIDKNQEQLESKNYRIWFKIKDESILATSERSFFLEFTDENGKPLKANQIPEIYTEQGERVSLKDKLDLKKKYYFDVNYGKIVKDGGATSYMKVKSVYYSQKFAKEITMYGYRKLLITPLPLFELN